MTSLGLKTARAVSRAVAMCAVAVVALATTHTAYATETSVDAIVPAAMPASIAEARTQPSSGTFAVPVAPGTQPLTQELLANYVERQNALRSFDGFYNRALSAGGQQSDVAMGYIARGSLGAGNTALQAISSFTADEDDSGLNDSLLSAYVQDGYLPTQERILKADKERDCLAQAIYHEARGESASGQMAVANVIVNRALSNRYPSSLCGVVYQNADKGRYRCQFTFACDGRSDNPTERRAWLRSKALADEVYTEYALGEGLETLPSSVLYYHTTAVKPSWSRVFTRVAQIGSHIFYAPN
ncbi:hypothetical protein GCM10007989_15520 [Devosia pacifica]|uniref:Cell wall hydrolase SleB domain-containing protein n=1 Tax=Devosia pacifica TaxID=1335967 RepID=A0A918S254_9HYPH|nr:cell wall hydrolase [Devosia pacifica]GHA21201.1 hypothetical protein GCM10007989_15520 [Devosia pacifica]